MAKEKKNPHVGNNCYIRNKVGCHCTDQCGYTQVADELASGHGGRRPGSGRPKLKESEKKEPTKVIRVPLSKLEEIKKVIGNT